MSKIVKKESKISVKPTQKLYKELSATLPKEAIQRTKGTLTKKGYDTTGFGYQYLVNHFNKVLGIGSWNWGFKVIKVEQGAFRSGNPFWEITGSAGIEIKLGEKSIRHTEYGGHRSSNYADALKGASTNAFKKTAAFFGVGKQAFEGSIDKKFVDEDNRNVVDFDTEKVAGKPESVLAFMEKMTKELDKGSIELWKAEINGSEYNDNQKRILFRKLEELIKGL